MAPTALLIGILLQFNDGLFSDHHHQSTPGLDVRSYRVWLEPNLDHGTVEGIVDIEFFLPPSVNQTVLNSGNLTVSKVTGNYVTGFSQTDNTVIITLAEREASEGQLTVHYHGKPTGGLLFNPEAGQAYTVFSTRQWMVCHDTPADRAKLRMDLLVSSDKHCVASGELTAKTPQQEKMLYSFQQDYETPPYTYGLVIGDFQVREELHADVRLRYYARDYPPAQLVRIFTNTGDMIDFFEEKSGVPYVQSTYSQILMGDHYQEMSGLAVLKSSYGQLTLEDSTETNLISHELAHQWWGNMITCQGWEHFWLNEGFATFMSAAYNEYRFGEQKYHADIQAYYEVYQDIKQRGRDKSLVFADWVNPSGDDRNLVYFKGAYVLHLLREEMGESAFWQGIKSYSRRYFGQSVETHHFQRSMEESSGQNLEAFFNEWVY